MRALLVSAIVLIACAGERPGGNPGRFVSVSAGFGFTCALDVDRAAICWGANQYGQLGVREVSATCKVDPVASGPCSPTPVRVDGALRFATIDAGEAHVCGLTDDGVAYCWGDNASGQLGSSDSTTCEVVYYRERGYGATPCAMAPRAVSTDLRFTSLSAASGFTCGLARDGSVYCWGHWKNARMSGTTAAILGGKFAKYSASEPFAQISAGGGRVCARTTTGRVFCWGDGVGAPHVVASDVPFTSVSRGWRHACAMASDRAVYCWGENDSGQLGNGEANATFNSGDTAVYRVASDVKFVSVDAGFVSTCAVAVNGDQYCWGDGTQIDARADGECRHAAAVTACALRPAKTSLRNVTGMTSGLDHRCAVSEGRVRCWGNNQSFAVSSDTSVVGTRRRDAQAR